MKLHLPYPLRRLLLSHLVALAFASSTLPLTAEAAVTLPAGRFTNDSASLLGSYTEGIFADSSHLSNQGSINVTGVQENAYLGDTQGGHIGISLIHSSTLSNDGSISVSTTVTDSSWMATGIIQTSGSFLNNGTLSILTTSNYYAYGIFLGGLAANDNVTIVEDAASVFTNKGQITLQATTSSSTAIGCAFLTGKGDIINNEKGATITTHFGTFGIESYGSTLNNHGTIDINNASSGVVLRDGSRSNNSGTIDIYAETGFYLEDDARLNNSGALAIALMNTNEKTYGIKIGQSKGTFSNAKTGTVTTTSGDYGIYSAGILENYGSMELSAEQVSIYQAEDSRLTNYDGGRIIITSEDIGIESHGSVTNHQGGNIIINAAYEGITSDSSITNSGNLDITTTKGATAWTYGINLTADTARFTNTQTGVVNIQSARYAIESQGSITNQGRITVDGDINAHGTLDNSGSIELNGCSLVASASVTNSGTITGAEGSIDLTNGGSLNNSGNIEVTAIYGSVTNSGTINAGSIMSLNNTADGIVTTKSIEGVLSNDGKINATGVTTTGMTLSNSSVNNGEITIDSQGSGISCSSFTNNGSIDITSGTGDGLEIRGYNGGGSFTNTGTITINSANRGIYGETVHNSGTITINAATCGIDTYYTFTNSGTLNVNIIGEEATCGVHVQRNFVNKGELNIDMQGSGSAPGILLTEMMSFYNSGTLHADSIDAQCAPSSSHDTSLNLLNNSVTGALSHDGTMLIRAVDNPYLGTSEYISNHAPLLNLGGTRGDDLQVTRTEGGSVVTVDSSLSLSGVKVKVLDDVRLKMGGDLTIAEDCSLSYVLMSTGKVDENGNNTWAYGTLTIDNGDSSHRVTMGNSINTEWNGAVAVENEVGTLKLSSEGGNTMRNGTLSSKHITVESANGTTMALKDMALTVSGNEITLRNVTVSGDSTFTSSSGALTLNVDGVTFVLDGSNSSGTGLEPVALFSVDPLTQTEVASNVFYIDSSMLEGVNVAGNLTLDLSYWSEEIQAGGYDSIALTFAEDMAFDEETEVMATLNGANFALADYTEDNMVQFNVANLPTHVIPEPTTATLSLLALSMLAARRRRR